MGKFKYVLGTITILVIAGGTYYLIKKYKDQELDEEPMTFEEAQALVDRRKQAEIEDTLDELTEEYFYNDVRTTVDPIHVDEQPYYFETHDNEIVTDVDAMDRMLAMDEEADEGYGIDEETEEEFDDEGFEEIISRASEETTATIEATEDTEVESEDDLEENQDAGYEEIAHELHPSGKTVGQMMEEFDDADTATNKELLEGEGKELRYEPNSGAARSQFIRMELAEWAPRERSADILLRLFEFPFNPINDGDMDLRTRIIDYRAQFFGYGSKWTKEVTYADVILYYARLAVYNIDEDIKYWVNAFLDFNELDETIPSHKIDKHLEALNSHVYHNKFHDSYGLFGLTSEAMTNAINIANRNIDQCVTYDIEFNEFLKMCM